MPQANPPTQPISTPTAQHAGSPSYASIPVIIWGAANDYAYNGSGGPSLPYGPFNTTVLRVALSASDSVRIARGDSTVVAAGTGTLFVGPGVEFVGINAGEYIAVIGNTAATGAINITQAL